MPALAPDLDRVFRALSNPTRRAVVTRLGEGPASVGELADPFDMALPSFLQHLRVLEDCGVVESTKDGRVRTYRLTPEPLAEAETWMFRCRATWEKRLDQLDAFLLTLEDDEAP